MAEKLNVTVWFRCGRNVTFRGSAEDAQKLRNAVGTHDRMHITADEGDVTLNAYAVDYVVARP
jgi:hypothetical protein